MRAANAGGRRAFQRRRSPSLQWLDSRRTMPTDIHRTIHSRLDQADYRYTTSRKSLVAILAEAGQPMSMPEILSAAGLPQSYAYRNLTVLEWTGVDPATVQH